MVWSINTLTKPYKCASHATQLFWLSINKAIKDLIYNVYIELLRLSYAIPKKNLLVNFGPHWARSSDGTKWHNLIQSWQVLRYPHKFLESAWYIRNNNCTAIFYFQECCHLSQSIGHPHPKPIKPQQAGWPLLSLCICCSGVMTTPVVSGCHWGPNGFHMPLRDIQLPVVENSCSHRGTAGFSTWLSDNK